jgi:hypothetical protein
MPYMVANRDDVVRTKAGHVVRFEKGEVLFVAENRDLVSVALTHGHTVVDAPDAEGVPTEPSAPVATPRRGRAAVTTDD